MTIWCVLNELAFRDSARPSAVAAHLVAESRNAVLTHLGHTLTISRHISIPIYPLTPESIV